MKGTPAACSFAATGKESSDPSRKSKIAKEQVRIIRKLHGSRQACGMGQDFPVRFPDDAHDVEGDENLVLDQKNAMASKRH